MYACGVSGVFVCVLLVTQPTPHDEPHLPTNQPTNTQLHQPMPNQPTTSPKTNRYAAPVWVTTRDPREGETDGVDYNFMEDFAFQVSAYIYRMYIYNIHMYIYMGEEDGVGYNSMEDFAFQVCGSVDWCGSLWGSWGGGRMQDEGGFTVGLLVE